MSKISIWLRMAVVVSLLWSCFAYLFAAQHGQLTGPTFVQWCVVPLVLAWGAVWVVSAFQARRRATASHSESAPKAAVETLAVKASAMTRFYARTFDLTLWSFLLGYPVGTFMGLFAPTFASVGAWRPVVTVLILITVFLIVLLPLSLWFDALIYRWFGNTPGKALLCLSVRTNTGERLSPAQYMKRNFAMWVPGLGLGLPLVSMVPLGVSGWSLQRTGATRWDRDSGYRVVGTRKQVWRVSVFIVLGSLMAAVSRMENQDAAKWVGQLILAQSTGSTSLSANIGSTRRAQTALGQEQPAPALPLPEPVAASQGTQTNRWKNPISGLPAMFDAGWHEAPEREDGDWIFMNSSGDQIIRVHSDAGYELDARTMRDNHYAPITRVEERVENGRHVWAGEGVGTPGLLTQDLFSYVSMTGESRVRSFMRIWGFKGSAMNWQVLYAADPAVAHNEDAQNFFIALLNSTRADQPPSGAEWAKDNGPIEWVNPVSGQKVLLDARWHFNPFFPNRKNPWVFNSMHCPKNSTGPCVGGEESVAIRYFPDTDTSAETLPSYAQALHSADDPIYPLLSSSREVVEGGRRVWEGRASGNTGLLTMGHIGFVRFWLFRGNGGFWRVSYAAETGFPRDDRDAEQFLESVLSTTTP